MKQVHLCNPALYCLLSSNTQKAFTKATLTHLYVGHIFLKFVSLSQFKPQTRYRIVKYTSSYIRNKVKNEVQSATFIPLRKSPLVIHLFYLYIL